MINHISFIKIIQELCKSNLGYFFLLPENTNKQMRSKQIKSIKLLLVILIISKPEISNAGNANVSLKFGNGLTISDADSTMSFNFGIASQSRIEVNKFFDKNSKPTITFMERRLRLKFGGYFLNQKLEYKILLSLSPQDVKIGNVFLDGNIKYKPIKQFALQFGQGKLPGDRENIASAENQFFSERSTTNLLFRLDRDFGVQLFGNFGKTFIFKPTLSIASGEGRNYNMTDVQHFDYTVRFDFLPIGEFAEKGDYSLQDFAREPKPKIAVGVAYDFNNKSSLQKAQNGGSFIPDSVRNNLHTIYTDAILKYKGLTTIAGYIYRKATDNKLYLAGQSFYASVSYLLKKKLELGTRYNRSFSGKIGNIPTVNEYSVGVAYYVFKNAFKLQTDYTIAQNITTKKTNGIWHFQMQFSF